MRLLPGLLAGQNGRFELTGDESLRSRPMERIAEPLRLMGATIETTEGRAPFTVDGGALTPITYELPVASAQVKSAVLLAGLYAEGGRRRSRSRCRRATTRRTCSRRRACRHAQAAERHG